MLDQRIRKVLNCARLLGATAIAGIISIILATGYVTAQTVGDDADDAVTFRIRLQNISADSELLFSPGVWALHSEGGPLFTSGEAGRGEGLESLAEDGDPNILVEALKAKGLHAGVFDTPVCANEPGALRSGEAYEFEVIASPETPYLSFATMFMQSNSLFLALDERSIALFDENGKTMARQDVTAQLRRWDAGTGRPLQDGPDIAALVQGSITRAIMVDRDAGWPTPTPPAYEIGEEVRVGDVRWRVLSAEDLGYILEANGDRETTEGRFIQVRFEMLNLGSDPLDFDGVPVRDNQGRAYERGRECVGDSLDCCCCKVCV